MLCIRPLAVVTFAIACFPAVDESLDYVHFLVPYEHEDKLPLLFAYLKVCIYLFQSSRTHSTTLLNAIACVIAGART